MTQGVGRSVGTVGGSLKNSASWLKGDQDTATVGLRGERRTAAIITRLVAAPGGPSALHDLRIPIPGIKANIDHIVVSGRTVTIIDSKVWKPGFYWTVAGFTFRGRERFAPADKKTMPMARKAIATLLAKQGLNASVRKPLLVVWPSGQRRQLRLGLLRSPGARAVTGDRFTTLTHSLCGARPADPAVFAALSKLTIRSARPAQAFADGELDL